MNLLTQADLVNIFKGKRVVIVGSAPSGRELNTKDKIESYDEVIRVNNYKTKGVDLKGRPYDFSRELGIRTDYHYSFYGGSIRKTAEDLKGIKGHLCKCPNDDCHVTDWHRERNQQQGGDFRPIYRRRKDFWIAPVYIPEKDHYMKLFDALGNHVPSTGFACIWELLQCQCKELYVTGFDWMTSRLHNVDELWRPGNQDDPIKHVWDEEVKLMRRWVFEYPELEIDSKIRELVKI
jgi:hypothetical protein